MQVSCHCDYCRREWEPAAHVAPRSGGTTSTDRAAAATSGTRLSFVWTRRARGVLRQRLSAVTSFTAAPAAQWMLRSGLASRNRNSISVTVLDQYGDLYRGGHLQVELSDVVDPSANRVTDDFVAANPTSTQVLTVHQVSASGRRTISYTHNGTDELTQTVSIGLEYAATHPEVVANNVAAGDPVQSLRTPTVAAAAITAADDVEWADRSTAAAAAATVQVGDAAANEIVVDVAGAPVAYQYGPGRHLPRQQRSRHVAAVRGDPQQLRHQDLGPGVESGGSHVVQVRLQPAQGRCRVEPHRRDLPTVGCDPLRR